MKTSVWNLDQAHTSINFAVRHMVVSKVRGHFANFSGTLRFDDADLSRSTAEVRIDASSLYTGAAERDVHLRSPDFFDVARFPDIHFRSKRVEQVSRTKFRIVGDLTIRDQTREVTLDAAYGGHAVDPWGNERLGFVAEATVDRKAFGLKWNQLLEAGGAIVGDQVDIELELEAVRANVEAAA